MELDNRPKKSLGQNFLIDNNIIEKIVKIAKVTEKETILEIGPGLGSLTNLIARQNPKIIYAVEKDKKLVNQIKTRFVKNHNIKVIHDDILNLLQNNKFGKNIIIFGNLPYNISTKIIAELILLKKWPPWYKNLIFMFQKEVADRIIAKSRSKNFGRLSILCNWRLEITKHFDISKNCFFPKPKINSTVLSFKPKKKIFEIKNPKNLENVTRILFSNRRKMINKSFLKLFKGNQYVADDLKLNLNCRAEELSQEIFYKITMKYEELFC
jgi:16S rRNA (adenine1518-N6/adenine1519-N6)-dimethyltransferase